MGKQVKHCQVFKAVLKNVQFLIDQFIPPFTER